jgi:hypothetical protein
VPDGKPLRSFECRALGQINIRPDVYLSGENGKTGSVSHRRSEHPSLARNGVDFVVAGGFAIILKGYPRYPRLTLDAVVCRTSS